MNAALCLCCVLLAQNADQPRNTFGASPFQRPAAPPAEIPADTKATAPDSSRSSAAPGIPWGNGTGSTAPKTLAAPANENSLAPLKSAPAATAPAGTPISNPIANGVAASTSSSAASQLVNEALAPPRDGAMSGRPLSLLQVLAKTSDRANQLRITRAYWRLTTAVADYYWTLEERGRLAQIDARAGTPDAAIAKSAQASASARVKEAELTTITAQNDLAEAINQVAGEPLPLTSDAPYIGAYRTFFDRIFSGRNAPNRVKLIDRTLPVRREAIDARAQAVINANEAAAAAQEAYRRGQGDIHSVLSAQSLLRRERQAFLNSVRDYNYDIAEYALAAADGTVDDATLVGMLIKTKNSPGPAGTSSIMREPTPAVAREPRGPQASADADSQPTADAEEPAAVRQVTFEEAEEEAAKKLQPKVPFSVMVPAPMR